MTDNDQPPAAPGPVWEDERVRSGMTRQLLDLNRAWDGGAGRLGWKLGLGAPQAGAQWGISGPVVGYLTRETQVASGGRVDVGGWSEPRLEPEIAIYVGRDIPAGVDSAEIGSYIAQLGLAIELVDFGAPQSPDLEAIIADNVFHRAVLLGEPVARQSLDGVVHVEHEGTRLAVEDPPAALGGTAQSLLAHAAEYLSACGSQVRAGDVLISGALAPAMPIVEPGETRVDSAELGEVSVAIENRQ